MHKSIHTHIHETVLINQLVMVNNLVQWHFHDNSLLINAHFSINGCLDRPFQIIQKEWTHLWAIWKQIIYHLF